MTLDAALADFYERHGFGDVPGARPKTVPVYTGCLLVPLPNIETRNRYLKYHDLHHLITGYSVGRIGEGEVSSWELGTGSMLQSPVLGVMNLIALSTGWVLDKDRMWEAYARGVRSKNLYSKDMRDAIDNNEWPDVEALRDETLEVGDKNVTLGRRVLFRLYIATSLFIHALIAIPAMIARTFTDLKQGKSLKETFSPVRRSDLY